MPAADCIAEASIPLGVWWQLTDTNVEVRWIERSGIRWLQHRLVAQPQMVLCPECCVDPDHPDADDPITWCDCQPHIGDHPCAAVPCKQRAHAPEQCPQRRPR